MRRQSPNAKMYLKNANEHGRLIDLTPDWIDVPYPEDVAQLLVGGDDSNSISFEADEFSSCSDTSDIEV